MTTQTEIEILKLEKELAQLDADWYKRLDSFKIHGRGKDYLPNKSDSVLQIALAGLVLLVTILKLIFNFWESMPVFVCIIFIIVFAAGGFYELSQWNNFEQNQNDYLYKRKVLLSKIESLKKESL